MSRILVIDDDNLVRGLIAKTLRGEGHEVDEARDGAQGIEYLESGRYDLVITDLVMPNKSGFNVSDYIQEKMPSTPILLVSSFSGRGTGDGILEFADYFADETLPKPFQKAELLEAVERLVNKAQARRGT